MILHGLEVGITGPIDDDKTKEYEDRIGAGMMNKYLDGLSFNSVYFELNYSFKKIIFKNVNYPSLSRSCMLQLRLFLNLINNDCTNKLHTIYFANCINCSDSKSIS